VRGSDRSERCPILVIFFFAVEFWRQSVTGCTPKFQFKRLLVDAACYDAGRDCNAFRLAPLRTIALPPTRLLGQATRLNCGRINADMLARPFSNAGAVLHRGPHNSAANGTVSNRLRRMIRISKGGNTAPTPITLPVLKKLLRTEDIIHLAPVIKYIKFLNVRNRRATSSIDFTLSTVKEMPVSNSISLTDFPNRVQTKRLNVGIVFYSYGGIHL